MTDERAEKIRRRRRYSIGVGVFACFCLLMMCWKAASNTHAWWLYRHSRSYPYSGRHSFEFLAFGITAGDTELLVDQKLGSTSRAGASPTAPTSLTTFKIYSFDYGHDFFIRSADPVLSERVTVYFDENGQAFAMECFLYGDQKWETYWVNLLSKSVEKKD